MLMGIIQDTLSSRTLRLFYAFCLLIMQIFFHHFPDNLIKIAQTTQLCFESWQEQILYTTHVRYMLNGNLIFRIKFYNDFNFSSSRNLEQSSSVWK